MPEGLEQYPRSKPVEAPKPKERLSDEEMGNLLVAFGNSEAKAVTLLLMKNGNVYAQSNLHKKMLSAQGKTKGWIISGSTLFRYCSLSLAPISGIVEEVLDHSSLAHLGFRISNYGQRVGIPMAGLLLDFSERQNISLQVLFGETKSTSVKKSKQKEKTEKANSRQRTPLITLGVIHELISSPNLPLRETDLSKKTGESKQVVLDHLKRLQRLGLIQFKSRKINRSYGSYKLSVDLPEENLPTYAKDKPLGNSVFEIFKNHPNQHLTREDVYNLLPEEIRSKWSSKDILLHYISGTLSFFSRHSYLRKDEFSREKQSKIWITEKQREILTELLDTIDRFQKQDEHTLKKGQELAERIITDSQRVSSILKKARETSSSANKSPISKTRADIDSLIKSSLGIKNDQIQKLLEGKYGKKLGISSIQKLTSSLVKQGKVRFVKDGRVSSFFPKTPAK